MDGMDPNEPARIHSTDGNPGGQVPRGIFPTAGAWKQEGSVLSAYAGGILVGRYDCAQLHFCATLQSKLYFK